MFDRDHPEIVDLLMKCLIGIIQKSSMNFFMGIIPKSSILLMKCNV